MATQTRMRISRVDNRADVYVMVKHPMDPGYHGDNPHYIETVHFMLNNQSIANISLGPGVSENPLIGIVLNAVKPGDRLAVQWIDNRGSKGATAQVID